MLSDLTQGSHGAIQEAFDVYCKENGGQSPSIYRLALLSGQSKYFCRQFLEKIYRNPQQANDDRRQKSQLKLQRAYEGYLKKHKEQPSIRALASLAKASLRSAQSYLKMLPVNLPKVERKKTRPKLTPSAGQPKGVKPNPPKVRKKSVNINGEMTPDQRAKLDKALKSDYFQALNKADWWRLNIERLASDAGVGFWTAKAFLRELGLVN